jgi:hypothetical protein
MSFRGPNKPLGEDSDKTPDAPQQEVFKLPRNTVRTAVGAVSAAILLSLAANGCGEAITSLRTRDLHPIFKEEVSSTMLWIWDYTPDKEEISISKLGKINLITLADAANLEKVRLAKEILQEMMSYMPLPMIEDVKKLILVFGEEGEGPKDIQTKAITPDRDGDTQYIFFAANADEPTIKHEFIHALWQTDEVNKLPNFLIEGPVHALANPEPGYRTYLVEPDYLFTLSGVFPEDGNLSMGQDVPDADLLQYEVLQAFWDRIAEIDPQLPFNLLQPTKTPKKRPDLTHIPLYILAHASPEKKKDVAAFLTSCKIFEPPKETNVFFVPDVSDDAPAVVVYYVDENHLALPGEVPVWWSNEVYSDRTEEPTMVTSNFRMKFTREPLSNGYDLTFQAFHPEEETTDTQTFVFNADQQMWLMDTDGD